MVNIIKAVIFDLDDTLYNEREFVYEGFKEVCGFLSQKYGVSKENLFQETKRILNAYGRGKVFDVLQEKYGFNEDVKKLVEVYRNVKPNLKLYEDGEEILNYLKEKVLTGIITDGKASVQWNKINSLELKKYVDKIIVTDEYGRDYWKPHKYSYRSMLKYFKCNPEEAVYVGDNPIKDFVGARKVGIKTIRIVRKYGDNMKIKAEEGYDADYTVTNLKDIIEIIKKY